MRSTTCVSLLVVACCAPAFAGDAVPTQRAIENADSVIAIYPDNVGLGGRVPAIILAIWPDGQIVWSTDRVMGGAPYFTGNVDPTDVEDVVADLERDGLFADEQLNAGHYGIDGRRAVPPIIR
jgi:hypothetical protein